MVTLLGLHFVSFGDPKQCRFGNLQAEASLQGEGKLVCESPAGFTETTDVHVTLNGAQAALSSLSFFVVGEDYSSSYQQFTYFRVAQASPQSGPLAGATDIVLGLIPSNLPSVLGGTSSAPKCAFMDSSQTLLM